jgi:hypothetical protein
MNTLQLVLHFAALCDALAGWHIERVHPLDHVSGDFAAVNAT